MKTRTILLFIILTGSRFLFSQVAVNTDGNPTHSSAILDVQSTSKGFLLPRMSYSALYAIESPAEGLMVFCMDCGVACEGLLVIYCDGSWKVMNTVCLLPKAPLAGSHTPALTQITWNWLGVDGATGYRWNTTDNLETAVDMGTTLTYTETGLTPNTSYTRYVWSYNTCGDSPSGSMNAQTIPYYIGANYGGGIIFYIDGTGNHGLISAASDQSNAAQWGCSGTITGATGTAIGTGQANTTTIVGACSESGIAARICDDLELNGYSDWFLPSKDELIQMFAQKNVIGGFTNEDYFSSSECNATQAWEIVFWYGAQYCWSKSLPYYVRAIRAF